MPFVNVDSREALVPAFVLCLLKFPLMDETRVTVLAFRRYRRGHVAAWPFRHFPPELRQEAHPIRAAGRERCALHRASGGNSRARHGATQDAPPVCSRAIHTRWARPHSWYSENHV